jgi:galactan 5-O-arabinofuranosyltransferase
VAPQPTSDGDGPRLAARQRVMGVLLEALAAATTIVVFLAWCRVIKQNPLIRTSQVSGMAKIDLRFLVMGFVMIGATLVAERFGPPLLRRYAQQMACAAFAALASSLVAGGVLFALNGTPYGILAGGSDFGWIAEWIEQYKQTGSIPSHYPPLPIYFIWAAVATSGEPVAIVTKPLEIIGTAVFGPLVYFCWRMLLKPIWALAIGVVAMLPFIEPFKVYAHLVLVVFVPVMIKFFTVIRRSDQISRRAAAWCGAAFGAGFALLFLSYSGWFVWALPGAVVTFALVAPWRTAPNRPLLLAGTALAVFLPLSWIHLRGLLSPTGGLSDDWQYFDTRTEPAYIAMWRNDSGAGVGPVWPPLGELGNVGVFSVLLVAGLALALVFGWRRTPVIAICSTLAGAWLLRLYLAGKMWESGRVRLYPRTTQIILYLLLILIGFAIYYGSQRIQALYQRLIDGDDAKGASTPTTSHGFGRGMPLGVMLAPLLLLFLFIGSATVDRLMPANRPGTDAYAIWISHATKLPDGTCPTYGRGLSCVERR